MGIPPTYLQLVPNGELPTRETIAPFRCVVIIDAPVSDTWQISVSRWLVESGCLYMMAWGPGCSSWDDTVDMANLEEFDYGDIPEDRFVMTTWHTDESLAYVFWFAKELAHHPTVELCDTLLLHISPSASEAEMLAAFENAKD